MAQHDQPSQIDRDIASLKSEISAVRHALDLHRTALVSHAALPTHLHSLRRRPRLPNQTTASIDRLAKLCATQSRHCTETAYRLGAGLTAFHVKDPDPHAVDGGRVLGIRIEVFDVGRGAFETPYFVFLVRDGDGHGGCGRVRVHKHTMPPCVGVRGIAERFLGSAKSEDGVGKGQDVVGFARRVRREVVGWRRRISAVRELKKEVGLLVDDEAVENREGEVVLKGGITRLEEVDSNAREVMIEWSDGSVGRVKVATDGTIEGVAVRSAVSEDANGTGSRMRQREASILGGNGRVEGIVRRLLA